MNDGNKNHKMNDSMGLKDLCKGFLGLRKAKSLQELLLSKLKTQCLGDFGFGTPMGVAGDSFSGPHLDLVWPKHQ